MPTLELSMSIKQDGVVLPNTTITTRLTMTDIGIGQSPFITGGGFRQIGATPVVRAVLLRPLDEAVTVRLNDQSDAGVVINAGGLMVLFDCVLDAGGSDNLALENSSGSTTQLLFMEGGFQS